MATTERSMGDRLADLRAQLPYLPRALGLVWRAARRWTVAWLALLVLQGGLPVAIVYLTRALVDGLVGAVEVGDGSWPSIRGPLLLALVMAALLLLSELLRALTRLVRTAQGELVRDHVSGLIHERAVAADLAFFESPDYHDRLHRARIDAQSRPAALVENLGGMLQNLLTLLAMAAVLVRFGWWVPVALIGSTLPALAVVVRYAVRHHRWRMRTTADERRTWYYDWLLTGRETAPEVRAFDLGGHFREAFSTLRTRLRGERIALARGEAAAEIAAGGAGLVVLGGVLGWMVVRALRRLISLGDLAMFFQAFSQGQKLMRSLLETMGQLYSNMLFLGNLFEFLEMEPEIVSPAAPRPLPSAAGGAALAFRGVTFGYPSSRRPVLAGLDLEIPAGQVVALLGANGAGKSTLIKLACRLYDPQQGRVEIDGRDIRELELGELRRLIAVLFQEPVHFSETVRRNVQLGDLGDPAGDERVQRALAAASALPAVERLPDGADTLLGTWFTGGAELSVGEWQRLAMARALVRDARIVLLDEPTGAMDSWTEAEWMGRFLATVEGRTVVVITHRLSTAVRADRIVVIDEGRVAESGSHRQLIGSAGRYAAAWRASPGFFADSGSDQC